MALFVTFPCEINQVIDCLTPLNCTIMNDNWEKHLRSFCQNIIFNGATFSSQQKSVSIKVHRFFSTHRNEFFHSRSDLSTKEKTEADIEKLVRESLTNFRTDYIDLYLIHWPGKHSNHFKVNH